MFGKTQILQVFKGFQLFFISIFISLLQRVKERFFKPGAPYEISSDSLKSWSITNVATMTTEQLYAIQNKFLDTLTNYW